MSLRNPSHRRLLYAGWCLALTLLAYGDALWLPFFFDDFVHLPFVDAHSLSEIWTTSGGLAYYRPLPFTIWKLMHAVAGFHSPVLQHGFNLLLHLGNGLLVGWLAGQLFNHRDTEGIEGIGAFIPSFIAAALFLLFPFSYQAVPWVGSLAHLLVTSLILLSLAAYWRMRLSGRWGWGVVSLAFAVLAPFAHENGALVGPLLGAILITRRTGPRAEGVASGVASEDASSAEGVVVAHASSLRPVQPDSGLAASEQANSLFYNGRTSWKHVLQVAGYVVLWTLPALLWLPVWWLAPKAVGSVALGGVERLVQNSAYFLQAMAYPLAWLGPALRGWLGMRDLEVAFLLSGVALGGAALIQWLGGGDRRSWLPWLWCGLAALPAILFLRFDYVINGPRLLMLMSVGIAWLWTDVALRGAALVGLGERKRAGRYWWRAALLGGLLVALLGQNLAFVRERMRLHQMLGAAFEEATALTLAANERGRVAVLVNLPSWLAPGETTYALGHEGVQFWPDYAPQAALAAVNSGRPARLALVRQESIRPPMPYFYGLSGPPADWRTLAAGDGEVFVTEYGEAAIHLRLAGDTAPVIEGRPPLARFTEPAGTGQVLLVEGKARQEGDELVVELLWQVEQPPGEQVTAFVHVVDEQGQLIGQADGDPLAGSFPLSQWGAGMVIAEMRRLAPAGRGQQVLVGLYDRVTGERLAAVAASGEGWADGAVVLPVE